MKCGMRNAECGVDRSSVDARDQPHARNLPLQFRIPHSAFPICL